jgi:hypothetical protein
MTEPKILKLEGKNSIIEGEEPQGSVGIGDRASLIWIAKTFKFKGREQQYRREYRTIHKAERKLYDKAYNRQYYLTHRGKNVKETRKKETE